jgi:hypothetical protein
MMGLLSAIASLANRDFLFGGLPGSAVRRTQEFELILQVLKLKGKEPR